MNFITVVADDLGDPYGGTSDEPLNDGHYLIVLLLAVGAVALGFKNLKQMRTNEERLPNWARVILSTGAAVFILVGFLLLMWFAHAGRMASR